MIKSSCNISIYILPQPPFSPVGSQFRLIGFRNLSPKLAAMILDSGLRSFNFLKHTWVRSSGNRNSQKRPKTWNKRVLSHFRCPSFRVNCFSSGGLVVSQVRSVVNMSRFHICLQIHETSATPCRDRRLLTGWDVRHTLAWGWHSA